MMFGEDNVKQNSRNRSSGSSKFKKFGVLSDIVNGSTSTVHNDQFDEDEEEEMLEELGRQIEWNKWLEEISENYVDFMMKIRDSGYPFFNLPMATTKAFHELIS